MLHSEHETAVNQLRAQLKHREEELVGGHARNERESLLQSDQIDPSPAGNPNLDSGRAFPAVRTC